MRILGRTIPLKRSEDDDLLMKVVEYVQRKMEETKSHQTELSDTNVAILAALNIADEFFRAESGQRATFSQIERHCDELIRYVDEKLSA